MSASVTARPWSAAWRRLGRLAFGGNATIVPAGRSADGGEPAGGWDQFGPHYDQPPFAGSPRVYVIASMPRSGSHLLGHLLFATGDMGSPLEYFHAGHRPRWQERFGVATMPEVVRALFRHRTSPSGVFGAKAHWPQFADIQADPALRALLDVVLFVQIRRRDAVAQAVSLVVAEHTGGWISFQAEQREPVYDGAAIARALLEIDVQERGWSDHFAREPTDVVRIDYEDLVADQEGPVRVIRDRLGLPAVPRSPREVALPGKQGGDRNRGWRDRFRDDLAAGRVGGHELGRLREIAGR